MATNSASPNDKQQKPGKGDIGSLQTKGGEVLAALAGFIELTARIEAAVLEFEDKKLEVVAAIRLERNAAVNQILSERQKSLNQIAAARDGAIAAIHGDPLYRAALHNQPDPYVPGQATPTA